MSTLRSMAREDATGLCAGEGVGVTAPNPGTRAALTALAPLWGPAPFRPAGPGPCRGPPEVVGAGRAGRGRRRGRAAGSGHGRVVRRLDRARQWRARPAVPSPLFCAAVFLAAAV